MSDFLSSALRPERRRRGRAARRAGSVHDLIAGPIQGEPLGTEGLAERARELARGQRLRAPDASARRTPLLTRLADTRWVLDEARERLIDSGVETNLEPAGEWLLDNFHVLDEHVAEVRASLPRSYYGELPELATGQLAGYPRVYEIATTLIGHTEGRIDRGNVELFVAAFQDETPLRIGELWAMPAMLRLGLIENVRRMALRMLQRLEETRSADRWSARLVERSGTRGANTVAALTEFVADHPPLTPAFVTRLVRQLRQEDDGLAALAWLEPWLADQDASPDREAARANERLALTQAMTANSITSLRAVGQLDWKQFVERHSRMEDVLRADPAAVYAGMTFATRDRYRHAVERIAKRTGRPEPDVAEEAVALAAAAARAHPTDAARGHVGYYLVDAGLPVLERVVGYRPRIAESMRRVVLRHPNVAFFGGVGLITAAAVAAVLSVAGAGSVLGWGALVAVALLALVPASEIAVRLVNQLVTALLPPTELPKLDLDDVEGVPAEFRTAVVIPTLFGSVEAVQEALSDLEVQFLANREANLHFAVLSDFTDAATETVETDDAIVAAAVAGVRALNHQYAQGRADEFYLFHRPRRWNPQQGVWMGWERKRGKLAEFNRFLRGGAPDAFSVIEGDVNALRGTRYAITLDADTVLPPGAAPLLVGAIAHPLNRAVYDPARGRVTRGFGILQPRVGVSLPSAQRSRFASIMAGHAGVDPYATAASDVYQDLFGEGSFTGKGIYDVDAFEQATHGRFPENTLLSHDLIEGSYARAGLASDVEVFDDHPTHYLTHARRKHRWIRGDWQLLRWLSRRVPGPDGPERNRLSLLSRWRLLDNLRRSLVEIGQLGLLVAGWAVLPGSPLVWSGLALVAIAAPWIFPLVMAALRPPRDRSWRAHYRAVGRDTIDSARQVGLTVAFLPHQAWNSADAIVRSLWRTLVSHRNLLQWQTASHAERAAASSAGAVWRAMWPSVVLALVCGALTLPRWLDAGADARSTLALTVLPVVLLWGAAPALAHALSAPRPRRRRRLGEEGRAAALRYAAAHWQYFERFVSAETHWLAPDNFQDVPEPEVAMRTSPTNIGLQLLATVSAHDLGLLSREGTTERLELAFASLARMQRYRGHFYNWYDLRDLRVLEPAYVSTVDSGNLAGHLIALRGACLEMAEGAEAGEARLARRLRALARECGRLVAAMDFTFLYDEERKLFSIGYQTETRTRDASSYDLLASEARLASFVAIAQDQVPVEHWFRLGRALTHADGETALVSWSGSMFEYLMPALVMRSYARTVLDQTLHGAVRRHIAYAGARTVPWGVSESAYNVRDRHFTYQYRAFGVPDLALKRGLGRELVVAPYATALAAMVDPVAAIENLVVLERLGALGPYGFRDALDYTRPTPGARYALVHNYMAHHVGMSLVALANVLTGDRWADRFHADPLVRAAELLLQERIPRRVVFQPTRGDERDEALPAPELELPAVRVDDTPDTPQPRVALLGHLPYTIMVDNRGGGYSRYKEMAVSRWRPDATTGGTGQFCYVKDLATGRMWSAAHQPVCAPYDRYRAELGTDRVTFHRLDGEVETRSEITAVPSDAAEIRRVTVTNHGSEPRIVELTSYAEVVLAPPAAAAAHPAFANLFVETEWHEWCTALFATRRPRSDKESRVWGVHVVSVDGDRTGPVSFETDRARFIGRGCSTRDPRALEDAADGPLNGRVGAVLDPIFALRARVTLAPGASATVAFTTLVAETRERAFALADRYDDPAAAQRALDLAWTTAQVELRELEIAPADAAVFQDFAGHLLYADRSLGAPAAERSRHRGSQPLLWAAGISGDWPILLATIDSPEGLPTLRQLLLAHRYWRRRGVTVDLVILDTHPPTYLRDHRDRIDAALAASLEGTLLDQPGGVFVRRADLLAADTLLMLRATARVHVTCDGSSIGRTLERLAAQLAEPEEEDEEIAAPRRSERSAPPVVRTLEKLGARLLLTLGSSDDDDAPATDGVAAPRASKVAGPPRTPLLLDNGTGGLTPEGDYEIHLRGDALPPAPWVNVIANARAGFVVSERGAGSTWVDSSYFFRLTPWHNDPVSDPIGDVLYLRDEERGPLWSATPAPIRHASPYVIRHLAGRTTFEHEHDHIATRLTVGIAPHDPVKLSLLEVTNRDAATRRIVVTAYAEWTLGVQREQTRAHVQTSFDSARRAIMARNTFDERFASHAAFCALSEPLTGHTADRREFLGRNGTTAAPEALEPRAVLSGRTGAGVDPCAALQCLLVLGPGETRTVCVALGAGADEAEATRLAQSYADAARARAALDTTSAEWQERLSVVSVRTPEPTFDAMVNRWALYQTLACRIWARSALYQSSGAYGFRDQLQDAMALLHAEPALAREHILRAAARQFAEGDVQHWWHPHSGRGVRTRFSDDLAWLPYVVDHYVTVTGDATVLDEHVPFLRSAPLTAEEHERYDLPTVSEERASVYEHCLRALRRACTTGAHGLPLIGIGDWNDGMSRVGVEGRGESVWLAWFLARTLRSFAMHVSARGNEAAAAELERQATDYVAAVEAHGWDGAWYRRAYFDDGSPLGTAADEECRIDAIAQSWSVISGAGDPARQAQAMRALEEHLVNDEARLLMLLTPPFDRTPRDPGYIKGYLPGVRENGAQYTHAALWTVLATALRGDGDRAFTLFQMINPLTHARTPEEVATYKVEPYVVAADVYTAAGQLGRGGWTWYTGSASWMYRIALETILGFTRRGDTLRIEPRVPHEWPGFTIDYRYGRATYRIAVECVDAAESELLLDGRPLHGDLLPLTDDGTKHEVLVRVPRGVPSVVPAR